MTGITWQAGPLTVDPPSHAMTPYDRQEGRQRALLVVLGAEVGLDALPMREVRRLRRGGMAERAREFGIAAIDSLAVPFHLAQQSSRFFQRGQQGGDIRRGLLLANGEWVGVPRPDGGQFLIRHRSHSFGGIVAHARLA
jgi:hypothetical protein